MQNSKSYKVNKVVIVIGIVTTLILLLIYALIDPASNFFPKCPFYVLTSFKCPGCGSQRALHEILNLNFREAFQYNAFIIIAIPLISACLLLYKPLKRKFPHLQNLSSSKYLKWGTILLILFWWILRNIFNW